MSATTDAIRDHHRSLLRSLEQYTQSTLGGAHPKAAGELAAFLKEDLLPHAQGEELHLYPALNPILREHADPTATMSLDHQWIEDAIRRIDEIAHELPQVREPGRRDLEKKLSRLALQLLAVVTLHVGKEENAYLPVMERHMSEDAQKEILNRMHSSAESSTGAATEAGHGGCHCSCGEHS